MQLAANDQNLGLNMAITAHYLADENNLVSSLIDYTGLSKSDRQEITQRAKKITRKIRQEKRHIALVDALLQEYGLSSAEGITLMRLAEAFIRTPDRISSNLLMRDKLIDGNWDEHKGGSQSFFVNGATLGLQLSSSWIKISGDRRARHLAARLGDRALHGAMTKAMALMGDHFVLGHTIKQARAKARTLEKQGYSFSYDMLGEAAHTDDDAQRYYEDYEKAARYLAKSSGQYSSVIDAPSISVKLSALHPRYEYTQASSCVPALVDKLIKLALIAKNAGLGLTIDAEEAERLEVSLLIIERLLAAPELSGWDGLGFVVQAYQRRALHIIDWLIANALRTGRKLMVRLVKGAYWDMEIKRAQELGLESYPVFTRKENTDVSYLACARKLLGANDVIFTQFATHNAQSAMAVEYMASQSGADYEFQRLHGMGDDLHAALIKRFGKRSRIYAPVGKHEDLLPYLVRRLLENGANSSFVNQLMDKDISIDDLVHDPVHLASSHESSANTSIPSPRGYLQCGRSAAKGEDWTQERKVTDFEKLLKSPPNLTATSIINGAETAGDPRGLLCPFDNSVSIGKALYGGVSNIDAAIKFAKSSNWASQTTPPQRAAVLQSAADKLEDSWAEFISLCVWEAGKTVPDAIAEIREAIDFCRYYADQAQTSRQKERKPLGSIACISPWNFPLAIFLGQITAALSVGNTVIAKPAQQTPLIAYAAVQLLHECGIPKDALHLLIGDGAMLGSHLTAHEDISAVCFTGSTRTAKIIAKSLADTNRALTPLIAETGGVNAMIIDSTALLEQAVADVIASAFQSAGQRCSACRLVCIQEDVADEFIKMLSGAMEKLIIGAPTNLASDLGPVIDEQALGMIRAYIKRMRANYKCAGQVPLPETLAHGHYIAPIAFEVPKIADVKEEIFGPVLHIVRYKAAAFDDVLRQINALGFGLTMGLHTRIDSRAANVAANVHVGNLYVNRNQIGAVVGVQPFGGEGLSGTGPKAGGPSYLPRLSQNPNMPAKEYLENSGGVELSAQAASAIPLADEIKAANFWDKMPRSDYLFRLAGKLQALGYKGAVHYRRAANLYDQHFKSPMQLPGPTGETNELSLRPRGIIACFGGETHDDFDRQIACALAAGNGVIAIHSLAQNMDLLKTAITSSGMSPSIFTALGIEKTPHILNANIAAAACDGAQRSQIASYLAYRSGPILPVLSGRDIPQRYAHERTLTINTTAAGGNATLLALG